MIAQAEYEALPGVNWSRLKLLRASPYHYRYAPPKGTTTAMLFGRAVHTLVLEPECFAAEYSVWDGPRRGRAWTEYRDAHSDTTIMTRAEADRAQSCADAVLSCDRATDLLLAGASEEPITWTDAETGRACKGRPDHAGGRTIDLKTTAVFEPRRFASLAARLGYHCQLAFYDDGRYAVGHEINGDPALIVVQSDPPHDVVVYDAGPDVIEAGRREYRRLLRLLIHCEQSDDWPGVARGQAVRLCLPEWAYADPDDGAVAITIGGERMEL